MPRVAWLRLRIVPGAFLCAAAVLISSCSRRESAEVTGKVTLNGEPVTAGTVYFVSADDSTLTGGGPLGPDGTFKAQAPVGKVKVAVQTAAFKPRPKDQPSGSGPPPGQKGGPPAWAKDSSKKDSARPPSSDAFTKTSGGDPDGAKVGTKYVSIPDKYEKVDTSELTFEVKPGGNDLGEIKLSGPAKK
ncbi:unnamed protein product [Gemmata massiliana]|uniref:Carboxypeptidase regulatory-like domain-containing protein n=1 Tax=Gemmata massiliana TaxID=1210884 RepID=A0A6P2D114_9BACT|nr:hypothetical protein [Gemmata massiliana]VTR95038.1 unnamed protein product [Gemmata massiliana]